MTDKTILSQVSPEEALASEVERDFIARRQARKSLERRWQLNINFVNGNQYCDIDAAGELAEEEKEYFWQYRRVFNHISAVVDTRLSKLSRVRPALKVLAASDDESDRRSAALASNILAAAQEDCDFDGAISTASMWSEICGTSFYKVVWNAEGGRTVGFTEDGKKVREGNIHLLVLSPFEIYPETLGCEDLDSQPSIIHAKAASVDEIYSAYGVKIAGRSLEELSGSPAALRSLAGESGLSPSKSFALVIERYIKPTVDFPEGRLTVVADKTLLFDGTLPYINGADGERGYPFIKQISVPVAGAFFGASVVERLIPLQRAYNAVKNRKHEFLNRISMGAIAVEDGSVDCDELAEDGLAPGKILVYRQGGTPPEMLNLGTVPSEFWKEEESLLSEFVKVSGTSDLSENADSFSGITSATGLQLILDQDDMRMNVAYSSIKRAVKAVGRHILRLFRQFAGDTRLMKYAGKNDVLNLFYFKGSDISSDDVVLEADGDLNMSAAQKRTVIYEILDKGLFSDSDGKLSVSAKNKILELLGYGSLAGGRDLEELSRARAGEENLKLKQGETEVKAYDDHAAHISEHKAFLLTEELGEDAENRVISHILRHEEMLKSHLKEATNG